MKRILSFGGGVNSTAILILHKLGKIKPLDLVIFADTGSEMPETYEYIEGVIKPLCKDIGLEFVTVGSPTLYEDYWNKRIIPFRMFRSCTDRYKIRPIKKYLKGQEYITLIGIDSGEKHRAKEGAEYPLIDLNIDRKGCIRLIEEFGLPVPIKSGCFFCPFTNLNALNWLFNNHRDLFLRAEEFEKNCSKYPEYSLMSKPLEVIRNAFETQRSLTDFIESKWSCLYCHQ